MRGIYLFLCCVITLTSFGCRRNLIEAKERVFHRSAKENVALRAVKKIIVFPFAPVEGVQLEDDMPYEMAKDLSSRLIESRRLFIVHPDVLKSFLGGELPLSIEELNAVTRRFGADGFIRPVITRLDISAEKILLEVDVTLFASSQEPRELIHFHKLYDSTSKRLLPLVKAYADMFDIAKGPYGWRIVLVKRSLFYSFVCWDIVCTAF